MTAVFRFRNWLQGDGLMSKRRIRIVILCEDLQHEVFCRRFFLRKGFSYHQLRTIRNPKGKGSGEQFVREHYAKEVRTYRSKSSYQSIALAVVIDADMYSVVQRLNQLDSALTEDSQQNRKQNEKIAIFVPKRNIETWIHFLREKEVDETTVYSKLDKEGDCKQYVDELVDNICPFDLPDNAPESLHTACAELQRIL